MVGCLNEHQRKKVEENHSLIYGYAKKFNIQIEKYYDILAIGLCKAALSHDSSKNKFSSHAYRCMRSELLNYYKMCNTKFRVPEENILYYDSSIGCDDENAIFFVNSIAGNSDIEEEVICSQEYENMLSILNEKERKVAMYIERGFNESEIAKMTNFSRQYINIIKKSIRKKMLPFLK